MPDLLCPLNKIPSVQPIIDRLAKEDIHVRRPQPWEQTKLRAFIEKHFTVGWADETSVAFSHQPVTAFIATKGDEIIGFASYECTRRNYFGPTGVNEAYRGKGIGKALFLAALCGLQELGYVYAIIGDAGPVDFYKKCVGAVEIPFSADRGIYHLKAEPRFDV